LASTAVLHWVEGVCILSSAPLFMTPILIASITVWVDCSCGIASWFIIWLAWLASTTVYHRVEGVCVLSSAPSFIAPLKIASITVWVNSCSGIASWFIFLTCTAISLWVEGVCVLSSAPMFIAVLCIASITVWVYSCGWIASFRSSLHDTLSILFDVSFNTNSASSFWVGHFNFKAILGVR